MGGGDLNLKKSWHPQTLKNIERVWKAEQRHEAECKKIEELQKELHEERAREEITRYAQETGTLKKKDDRLDWMYQGPGGSVSRDEYLLGRPIDKQITQQYEEPESGPSAQTGLLPGSIFNTSSPVSTLDLAAKIREDPLFAIRKREEEKKRKVLTNPVKMKMIKDMLRQNLEKEEEQKKKKKKRKKEKAAKKEKRKEQYKRHSTSAESLSLEKKEPRFRHRECTPPDTSKAGYGLQLPAKGFHHTLGTSGQQRNHTKDRSRSCSPHRSEINNGSFHTSNKKPLGRYSNISSQSQENHGREKKRGRQGTSRTKCLSAQERERKRQEMMDFARQRDEERVDNIQKYRRQEEQKKDRDGKCCHHAAFIHDMKLESAATSSLADRVKRNIHSLQRTPAALEKSFMKR